MMGNLGRQIFRCGSFMDYTDEEWATLPECPKHCEYLQATQTTKYLCDHPKHPMNAGIGRLSQRRKSLRMDCPYGE